MDDSRDAANSADSAVSTDLGVSGADDADASRRSLEPSMVEFDRSDSASWPDTFAELALELHESATVEETVETVVQFALQALGCSHAGLALSARGGQAEIVAGTDPVVAEMFQMQIDAGHGPLLTALQDQVIVRISDTSTDDRWPEWATKVAGLGVRSTLHVPLTTARGSSSTGSAGSLVGVLSLYSDAPDGFSVDDEAIADIVARHASIAVATARHDETMARAVDARKLVGQAMGILMERFDLDADHAFAILRRYSQTHNIKLRDVAQHLINTRKLPTSPLPSRPTDTHHPTAP
jgi:GAF domain-containing protein